MINLPPTDAEEAAEEGEEHVEWIKKLQEESGGECNRSIALANEAKLQRELDKKNQRADDLQEIEQQDHSATTEDVEVGVFRCFACPTHALLDES